MSHVLANSIALNSQLSEQRFAVSATAKTSPAAILTASANDLHRTLPLLRFICGNLPAETAAYERPLPCFSKIYERALSLFGNLIHRRSQRIAKARAARRVPQAVCRKADRARRRRGAPQGRAPKLKNVQPASRRHSSTNGEQRRCSCGSAAPCRRGF